MKLKIYKMENLIELYKKDNTQRCIGYYIFNDIYLKGRNFYYPNVLLYKEQLNDKILINPYDEMVMSLCKKSFYDDEYDIGDSVSYELETCILPVFFFIYNFDNYYHFLYDTLPYLFTYLELKKSIPELKILINYPNEKNTFYKFNLELLQKININDKDIIIHSGQKYKEIYISTSLTHGGYSNNPPRKEIFQIYDIIKNNIDYSNIQIDNLKKLKKIYISRRTWINKDTSNIGTDYTTRRKMINEDLLVDLLKEKGFTEIFSENLNTDEKIFLFSNTEIIVGAIGGGMSNLLFSNSITKSIVIETPFFLDINYRFKYSMEHTNIKYMRNVYTYKNGKLPLYCRVKIKINGMICENSEIGEISEYNINNDKYLVNISNSVTGFNKKTLFKNSWFLSNEFELLDNGLNSPYIINIDSLIDIL